MIDLRQGDCISKMREMEDNTVDFILTDPPYELGFMGKKWDGTGIAFDVNMWKEAFRVLKPGGYLMAFGGSRTYHRMAVALEDAGFEIKDMIEWVYGSGFPKALDISKALDKKLGKDREVIGQKHGKTDFSKAKKGDKSFYETAWQNKEYIALDITAPASDIAKQYDGYKTQLKPAHEPICLAVKPLSEKNYAENVMKWGTGGLSIDGTRVETSDNLGRKIYQTQSWKNTSKLGVGSVNDDWKKGRYPANLIIHENIAPVLDSQSSVFKSRASRFFKNIEEDKDYIPFIYHAKASKKDRNIDINGEDCSKEEYVSLRDDLTNEELTYITNILKNINCKTKNVD